MFTGIIQHVGRVVAVDVGADARRLRIDVGPLADRLARGGSVSVDGVCLTVSALSGPRADFDAVPETLRRTTLASLAVGDRVNLEPALPAGAPLDGHIVQGHVDALAEAQRLQRGAAGCILHLTAGGETTDQMVPKGSIALAGVSLTLATVEPGRFAVALVPTTLAATTLGALRLPARLNLELDILGKYVRKHLQALARPGGETPPGQRDEGVTADMLRRAGFG